MTITKSHFDEMERDLDGQIRDARNNGKIVHIKLQDAELIHDLLRHHVRSHRDLHDHSSPLLVEA